MRFWLAAFVVLFAAIELLEWVAQVGSWQPTGVWLVLGGMGLAAASNLSKFSSKLDITSGTAEAKMSAAEKVKPSETEQAIASTNQPKVVPSSFQKQATQDNKDSISFKVRPLKR